MMATQRERTVDEEVSILQDVVYFFGEKCGLAISTQKTVLKSHHAIDENAN